MERGKKLESDFRAVCKKFAMKANFDFHRYPDAKAGSMVDAPADFHTLRSGLLRVIECKETEHLNRLPYANFDSGQVARMRRAILAGAEGWVIIHHTKDKLYRALPVERFYERAEKGSGVGSWFFEAGEGLTSTKLEILAKLIHGMEV